MRSFEEYSESILARPLIYPEINGNYTNVLLIDSAVQDYQQFVDSVNSNTFPIVYSVMSTKTELLEVLHNFTNISRIGLVFYPSLESTFLDRKPLFIEPYSENLQFIIDIINEFQVKNIDFLACNTLNYPTWVNYFSCLAETGVIVGASNDKTGNIKYGGDWVMESTSEDIESIYFTKSIEYYTYLLDNSSWATSVQGLRNPSFLASDGVYIYVANRNNTISQISLSNPSSDYTIGWATTTQGLSTPYGLAIDNGFIYAANSNNMISKISLSNPSSDYTIGWATSTQGLNFPWGLAIADNFIYAANSNNTISQISLSDPSIYDASWATTTQGLSTPNGLAIDNGYIYVANNNNTISRISLSNPSSDYIIGWATSTQGLSTPIGLAITNGYIYVANFSFSTISQISLSNPSSDYTIGWATSTQGLNGIIGLAITNGFIYAANYYFNTISKISLLPTPYPCFKEGSKILTSQGYKLIQDLKKGQLVKTLNDYKAIVMIGKRDIQHNACKERIKDQLYVCSTENYEVWEDLVLTGCHSLLVDDFKDQEREKSIEVNGGIYVTENKYRLPACVDERAMVYEIPGTYKIYHLALENDDCYMNYGIYANGLLVESCSIQYLKELSNMTLIE